MLKRISSNTLLRHVGITTFANLSHAAAQWLLLVIVVKQFDELALGQLVLTLSIVTPVFLLLSFKLRTLVVTDFHNERKYEQYLHARFVSQAVILLALAALVPLALAHVEPVIIIAVVIFKLCDGVSELSYSYLHRHQAFLLAGKTQVCRSVVSISVLILSAWLFNDLAVTFSLWATSAAVFALFDTYLVARTIRCQEGRDSEFLKVLLNSDTWQQTLRLFRTYWPIGFSLMFGALFVYIPNYVLQHFEGTESVGRFAAVSYFLVAGGIFINSLSQAATPKLSEHFNHQRFAAFIQLTRKLMMTGAAIGIIGILLVSVAGEWILRLMYSEAISQQKLELQLIMMASTLRYSYIFLGSALNVLKGFNDQAVVYASGVSVLLLACLWLVPAQGMAGAGMAMVIACSAEFVVMILVFVRRWRQRLQFNEA